RLQRCTLPTRIWGRDSGTFLNLLRLVHSDWCLEYMIFRMFFLLLVHSQPRNSGWQNLEDSFATAC
ncbi:hypothetical protein Csa_015950, partial [Cucumis sativus]